MTLAEMSLDSGHVDESLRLLETEYERNSDSPEVAMRYAEVLQKAKRFREAIAVLYALAKTHPDDRKIEYALATALLQEDRMNEALALVPPERRDRQFNLACSARYEAAGNLPAAEEFLLAAWGQDTQLPEVWLKVAQYRRDFYNLRGEAHALRKVMEIDPDNSDAWERYFLNRAWSLDAAETIRAADFLEKHGRMNRVRLQTVLDFQLAKRDIDGAVLTAQKIADLPDSGLQAQLDHAYLLRRQGNDKAADQLILKMLRDPGIEEGEYGEVFESLRESALRNRDLDLAMRLTELPAPPALKNETIAFVADMVLEAGMVEEAKKLIAPLLADPNASADVLAAGFELARRSGDYQALPQLAERMIAAAGVFDDLIYAALDSPLTAWEWRRVTEKNPDAAGAWLGLARAALAENSLGDARIAADKAFPLLDYHNPIDSLAMLDVLLGIASREAAGSTARKLRLDQAMTVVEAVKDGPLVNTRWFLVMAADVYEREGRSDKAEQFWTLASEKFPDDFWSWLGMARIAASRGDEDAVRSIKDRVKKLDPLEVPANIRALVSVDLAMAAFYAENDPKRAKDWVGEARRFLNEKRELLTLDVRENLALFAEVAERDQEWLEAMGYWSDATVLDPTDATAWLGVARSAIQTGDLLEAWDALEQAEKGVDVDDDFRTQLAWQYIAAAEAVPDTDRNRTALRLKAERYGEKTLRESWNPDLAATLVWMAANDGDIERARSYLAGAATYRRRRAPLSPKRFWLAICGRKRWPKPEPQLSPTTGKSSCAWRMSWLRLATKEKGSTWPNMQPLWKGRKLPSICCCLPTSMALPKNMTASSL